MNLEAYIGSILGKITTDNTGEGVVFEDHGMIVGCDATVSVILGIPQARALWCHLKQFVTPSSLFRLAYCLDPHCHEQVLVRGRRPDGQTFNLQLQRIASLCWQGHEVGVISVIDPGKTTSPVSRLSLPAQLHFVF